MKQIEAILLVPKDGDLRGLLNGGLCGQRPQVAVQQLAHGLQTEVVGLHALLQRLSKHLEAWASIQLLLMSGIAGRMFLDLREGGKG